METPEKKLSILKAASSCFARYGYEKTTLDDIGRLVGLNKASLYYYYKNKESIYTEVIFNEANEYLTTVFDEVRKVEGCKDRVLKYISERLKYIRGAVNLSQLSIDSIQKLAPLFGDMYGKIVEKEVEYLSAVLDCCIKDGEITKCDTSRVAKSIITVFEAILNRVGACSEQSSTDISLDALAEVSFIVSLILDGLKNK